MGGAINEKLLREEITQAEEEEEEERVNELEPEVSLKEKIWSESKKMWVVAGPAIFTRVSTFGINAIGQAFIGHIGSTELAGYSLVMTVIVRFANGVLVC